MDNKVIEVPLSILQVNPWQPRQIDGYVVPEALVESIRKHGLLQVPVGRIVKNGHGDIVQVGDGWQRWQAFVKLSGEDPEKYGRLPVMVRDLSDQEMADLAVESNEKRNNLNPIELASFFRRYMADFKVTQEELGAKFSMSQPAVANIMRLLNLQPNVRALIISQEITATHGRSLLRIDDPGRQAELAEWAAAEKPTVAQLDREVLRTLKDSMRGLSKAAWPQPEFNVKACEGCEKTEVFQEMQWTGGKKQIADAPYCKDPKCWDRKQQSAHDKKTNAEKAKAQKVINANPDCVPLDKVPHDSYASFQDQYGMKPNALCKACPDFKKGIRAYAGAEPEEICTKPACYRNKKRNETMLQNRCAGQQWDYRLGHLMAEIDVSGIAAPICRVMLDQLITWQSLKVAGEFLGMSGHNTPDFQDRLKVAAAGQDLATQQKLVLRLLLEHYHDRDKYNNSGAAVYAATVLLLGKKRADEIDEGFKPDPKKPAKAKKAGASA